MNQRSTLQGHSVVGHCRDMHGSDAKLKGRGEHNVYEAKWYSFDTCWFLASLYSRTQEGHSYCNMVTGLPGFSGNIWNPTIIKLESWFGKQIPSLRT